MGRPIIKLEREGVVRYLEWSTICDAPVTYGMDREEFESYYREQYGREGFDAIGTGFAARMERVEATGTSSMVHDSVAELISFNRAGDDESCLSEAEIWDKYIERRPSNEDVGDDDDDDQEEDVVEYTIGMLGEAVEELRKIGEDDTVRLAAAIEKAISEFKGQRGGVSG